jgi:stage III sporulation protein AF
MSAYILGVVGVVFLGVLVDVVMPEGEMNKYIKGMFGIVALFVIVSPVQKLFDKDFNIEDVFYDTTATQIDTDFLEATNKQIKTQLENTLIVKLSNSGFDEVIVEIECNLSETEFKVEKVYVDISNMVINQNMAHINKYVEIKNIVTEFLNVEESDVIINE